MLVHNERFEILVVELVQLRDHVSVAEIRVLYTLTMNSLGNV